MSAIATFPDLDGPQQPPQGASQEPTADEPNQQTPQQNVEAAGLTDDDKKALLEVRDRYKRKWSYIRRMNIRRASRNFEYIKDNQYITWDPFTNRFYNPFEESSDGSQQGSTEPDFYMYVNNVIQWLERVFEATLSESVPKVIWMPDDADDDQDIATADQASPLQAKVERQNNAKSLLNQQLLYLFAAGNYFRYTRWLRDSDRTGVSKEPVWSLQDTQVKPDRFVCQRCGTETPIEQVPQDRAPMCPKCGAPLTEADFHEALSMPLPVQTGMEEVPNGQVCWSLYNTLQVDMAPWATEPSVDPTIKTPILDLEDEVDIASIRAAYPEAWDEAKGSSATDAGSTGDNDFARLARTRIWSSTNGRGQIMSEVMPTLSRCWEREWAFNILDDKKQADRLKMLFPNGVKVVALGKTVLEAVPENLTEHWTWCGTRKGLGAYPPAVCDPAIPFQDRINDCANNIHQYMDRLASPDVLANSEIIDVEAWNGVQMSGGGFKPVKPKKSLGAEGAFEKAFFQPEFHIDGKIFTYSEVLMQALQLIIGTTPQTYGGGQPHIDTLGGQKQALDVATGILGLYWKLISEENANSARISLKCFAKNATEDTHEVAPNEDGGAKKFSNQGIFLEQLQGEASAYPDVDQGLPQTAKEIADRIQDLLTNGAKNVLLQELLEPMPNRKLVLKHIGPPGMEVPGEKAWNLVMQDISNLVAPGAQPLPPITVPNPATGMPMQIEMPSVTPNKQLLKGYWDIAIQAWQIFGQKNCYKLRNTNPAGWNNLMAYGTLLAQFQAEDQPMSMPGAPSTAPAQQAQGA